MTIWQWINGGVPPYAEEVTIENTEQNIQKTLNRDEFKQPVPDKFVELTNAKKNNWGSTKDLDKPLCERYLFARENKWIWLDIPHDLMEELELPIGKSCPWLLYLEEKVLEREEVEGAITIENEKEIFLDKPVSEKNAEKELVKRMEELKKLREQVKELEDLKHEKARLEEKSRSLEETIGEKDEEIDEKEEQVNYQKELIEKETKAKEKLQKELEEIKNKKRDWKSFYDWLNANIVDKKEESLVNKDKQKDYLHLLNYPGRFAILLNGLERKNNMDCIEYPETVYYKRTELQKKFGKTTFGFAPFDYEEGKEIHDLFNTTSVYPEFDIYKREVFTAQDINKLFIHWKIDVPLQTTA